MSNNIDYQRRCAVSKAWAKEREQVCKSRGSRNWSQSEQKEIIRTGKCHGYEGQHMLSVKEHPEHAGNEQNIQFLTREEHLKAHNGNWKNDANGKYNLRTGKVEPFADGNPNIRYRQLSDPISDRSKTMANNQYQKMKTDRSAKDQKSRTRLQVNKSEGSSTSRIDRSKNLFSNPSANSKKYASANNGKSQTRSNGQSCSNGNKQGL